MSGSLSVDSGDGKSFSSLILLKTLGNFPLALSFCVNTGKSLGNI